MFNKMIINLKQNSQVTIPKEIVKKLKLKTGDNLSIVLENDEIKLKPVLVI
ncbi:MAG: AbrB/MazE/SpoVT family DNA-binding domain-containing protein, partial [Candidatus Humimicrobiaceae bacterium]